MRKTIFIGGSIAGGVLIVSGLIIRKINKKKNTSEVYEDLTKVIRIYDDDKPVNLAGVAKEARKRGYERGKIIGKLFRERDEAIKAGDMEKSKEITKKILEEQKLMRDFK